jgi:hypothetical protein
MLIGNAVTPSDSWVKILLTNAKKATRNCRNNSVLGQKEQWNKQKRSSRPYNGWDWV